MAALETLGVVDPSDTTQWIVIRGSLREGDFASLLAASVSIDRPHVTLDLQDVEVLTPGGCWALRTLADELWTRDRRLIVAFESGGHVDDALRSSRTIGHPHIMFHGRQAS